MEMLPWTILLRSINLSTQVCEMKNWCGNTLEMGSGASSIAFELKILFGRLYSIFVSMVIKKNRKRTRHYSELCRCRGI
jgi:hypothetical protein